MNTELLQYNHQQYDKIFFVGIGGAGMAPLALIMHQKGFQVAGSDLIRNANTDSLASRNIPVYTGHDTGHLPEGTSQILIVYSSAVGDDNPELIAARKAGWPCLRRGEMLAELAATYSRTVAVNGSHGKTTVTAMITHILKSCHCDPGYMIGGKVDGWDASAAAGNGDIFVTEVDESDGTNSLINSDIAVVTNVDDDHFWSVGGKENLNRNFINFASRGRRLVYMKGDAADKLFSDHRNKISIVPSEMEQSDYFTYLKPESGISWNHIWMLNAALSVKVAGMLGVDRQDAEMSLNHFPGVQRRMTFHYETDDLVIVEDYAHHPVELSTMISALRIKYPDFKFKIVFQPHRYARLEHYFDRFVSELGKADSIIITPVFSAWTEKGEFDSVKLAETIGEKATYIDKSWQEIAETVFNHFEIPTVIAIVGAGDIEKIISFIPEITGSTSAGS